ncbi:MAG: hypothetical protein HYY16_02985 [Planctomycetes bacterium]|nr:hypothetical protein [Planctomycetota bacterium]
MRRFASTSWLCALLLLAGVAMATAADRDEDSSQYWTGYGLMLGGVGLGYLVYEGGTPSYDRSDDPYREIETKELAPVTKPVADLEIVFRVPGQSPKSCRTDAAGVAVVDIQQAVTEKAFEDHDLKVEAEASVDGRPVRGELTIPKDAVKRMLKP